MTDLSRFRVIVLDFDGVIVDSETMQARAWTRVARELGGDHDREVTARQIAGRIDLELAGELFPGCDSARCAARKAELERAMEAAGELRPVDGVERFVAARSRTHRLAICSSCHESVLVRRLDLVGMRRFFGVVVGRSEGLRHKPAPDLYLRTLEQLGASADEACAIEDSPTGVVAAKTAGLYTVQLLHPGMPHADEADEWIERFDA